MTDALLLFDLDGTLIDSLPDLHAAANRMLRERGLRPLSAAQVRGMVGDGVPALVAQALRAAGGRADDAAALARFLELYESQPARLTRPYPGAAATLRALRRAGYRTAVCTNKPQHAALLVLRALDLLPLFDGIAGGDRFPVRKPDPGHLLRLIGELGGRPESAAMIGDNEHDAAAGRAAGLRVILMRHGYARVPQDTLGADALLDGFAALPAALARLGLAP